MHNLRELRVTGVDLSDASVLSQWANPISFLSNLHLLDMSSCRLTGKVPVDHLLNLSHLHSLQMDFNSLSSTIPDKLANLTSLSILDLTRSHLQGPVPYLPQLRELYAGHNSDLSIDLIHFFAMPWPQLEILVIGSTKANGSVPSSIANTTSLVYFSAYDCQIQGPIPSSITNLSKLEALVLAMNNIDGQLPLSIYSLRNLRYLSLIQTSLQGFISDSICNMSSLQHLSLQLNFFTGSLPDCINQLPNLSYLDFGSNKMNGTVSLRSFSQWTPQTIHLGYSGLTVKVDTNPFPPNFQPKVLDLSSCQIGGSIPSFISGLNKLEHLSLAYNNFSGEIPSWLFKLPSLGYLDLSFNSLQGVLPPNIQLHSYFGYVTLNLASNNLHGPIPRQLQGFESINLSGNNFSGSIPAEIDLRIMVYLSLSGNKLSGEISLSFCPESNVLRLLHLSNNLLSGTLPTTLGNCASLIFLNLGKNKLRGQIPNELEAARNLSYLDLSNNHFDGSFPRLVQKLQNLMVLKMGYNRFEGKIPQFIGDLRYLHILVLEFNSFNGSIPREINKLEKLQFIGFSNNKLSGPIPNRLDGLKMLRSRPEDGNVLGYFVSIVYTAVKLDMKSKGSFYQLEAVRTYHSGIDLSCNSLTGNIPSEVGLLEGLYMLNLSHNDLFGEIPYSIGKMTGLESLDLSFNNLRGEIPTSLNLLDALSTVNFSFNNLSGAIPSGTRFDTWYGDGSAYIGNAELCGAPGGISCNRSINSPTSREHVDDEDAKEKMLLYGIVFLGYGAGFWGFFLVLYLMNENWKKRYWGAIERIALRIINYVYRQHR